MWKNGVSPFVSDSEGLGNTEGHGRHQNLRCAHSACKQKAMPMTTFCHSHILSDPKQVLYKACAHVTPKRYLLQFVKCFVFGTISLII